MAVLFNETDQQRLIKLAKAFTAESPDCEIKIYTSRSNTGKGVYTSIEITGYLSENIIQDILSTKD